MNCAWRGRYGVLRGALSTACGTCLAACDGYSAPCPRVEDNSVRSSATNVVNLEAGYRLGRGMRVTVDVFNVLDAKQ
jgi:outer membrane receptor protein involved in Fe transport